MSSYQEELPLPKIYRQITFFSIYGLSLALLMFLFCVVILVFIPTHFVVSRFSQNILLNITLIGICAIAVFGIPFSCFFFLKQIRCRLVLTDQGLIRYDIAERQFTPWSNIVGIGYQGRKKGLRLKGPTSCSNLEEGLQRNIAALEVSKRNWIAWDLHASFFPISKEISERDWENGLLGIYLRKYAPHACGQK